MKSLGLNPGDQKIWGKISCKQPWKRHWGQQKYWKSYRDETSHGFRFVSNGCGAICWCLMSTLITNGSSQSILNLQNKNKSINRINLIILKHNMARANLNKSFWLVTNTTTASKYIPKRTRICINWNPPFKTQIYLVKVPLNAIIVEQDLLHKK